MAWMDWLNRAKGELGKFKGDKTFLKGATAAAAIVVAADGVVEDSEVDAAIKGLTDNEILKGSYSGNEIETELTAALNHAKSRSGKVQLDRALEALASRPEAQRIDVFMIAADVGDVDKETGSVHGIGDAEKRALDRVAKSLNLGQSADKLLAA